MIRIEAVKDAEGRTTWAVVDYLGGPESPEIRFTGESWECLSFVVGITSPADLAMA